MKPRWPRSPVRVAQRGASRSELAKMDQWLYPPSQWFLRFRVTVIECVTLTSNENVRIILSENIPVRKAWRKIPACLAMIHILITWLQRRLSQDMWNKLPKVFYYTQGCYYVFAINFYVTGNVMHYDSWHFVHRDPERFFITKVWAKGLLRFILFLSGNMVVLNISFVRGISTGAPKWKRDSNNMAATPKDKFDAAVKVIQSLPKNGKQMGRKNNVSAIYILQYILKAVHTFHRSQISAVIPFLCLCFHFPCLGEAQCHAKFWLWTSISVCDNYYFRYIFPI